MPTPISSQSAAAGRASSTSTGTSAATMLLTGAPGRPTARTNDVPRSPWKIRLKYWTYCSQTGLSSPRATRSFCTASSGARKPSSRRAGSWGTTK